MQYSLIISILNILADNDVKNFYDCVTFGA